MTNPRTSPLAGVRSSIRPLFFNCLTLTVIFTLCLYGLGVLGLYLRWFVLDARHVETPTPIIVTVVLPTEPGEDQPPIIITVVATRPPDPDRPATATMEPTPTQWLPSTPTGTYTYQGVLPFARTPEPEIDSIQGPDTKEEATTSIR